MLALKDFIPTDPNQPHVSKYGLSMPFQVASFGGAGKDGVASVRLFGPNYLNE